MSDHEIKKVAETGEAVSNPTRRNMLVGSGSLLVGGIAGRATVPGPASAQAAAAAPPLPWQWVNIDPMEAASRTYNAYLTQGG